MHIRSFEPADVPALIDLTIAAFQPLFEADLPAVLDPRVFAHDHGRWEDGYRREVPRLQDPDNNRFITVAEGDGRLLGYVGWQVNPDGSGRLQMVAVHPDVRRRGVGFAVCRATGAPKGTRCHGGPHRHGGRCVPCPGSSAV
jgi:ribosomal protein S18 acetylase RimI-like enzyme